MFKPLEGVKVIDLTYFVAGPGAARILADWGADVIKVEPSFGDPGRGTGATMSCPIEKGCNPFYTAYNANKRGLSLNLKSEEGKAVLYKLLETADVFLSSYRTGALKRLGLDYGSLSQKFPHLIWAQINGFGDFGPAKDNAGFDTVAFWARSGAMIDITEKDTSPVNPLIGFGDATTSCSLAGGISAALYQKAKTGKGCKVMISLFAQAIWSESAGMVSTQYGDEYPKTRLNPGSPVMDTFKSADDKWFYRLNVINIELPPLRCRRADILELANHFLARLNQEFQRSTVLSPEVKQCFANYQWPGNIRELDNVIKGAYATCDGFTIDMRDLPGKMALPRGPAVPGAGSGKQLTELMNDYEREIILFVLREKGGNCQRAAEELGIHRSALYKKMAKLGIDPGDTSRSRKR